MISSYIKLELIRFKAIKSLYSKIVRFKRFYLHKFSIRDFKITQIKNETIFKKKTSIENNYLKLIIKKKLAVFFYLNK